MTRERARIGILEKGPDRAFTAHFGDLWAV
jgi:hypothetical protein